jgi:hypothetical protein
MRPVGTIPEMGGGDKEKRMEEINLTMIYCKKLW